MSNKTVVETVYGKLHKFEIMKESGGVFGNARFYVYRDGSSFKGPYDSLSDAVDSAKNQG